MLRRRRLFWSGLDLLDMVDQWLRASNPKLTLCDALTLLLHSRSNSSGWTSVHWTLSYCLHIAFIWCVAFGGMAYHGIIWFIYGLAKYCLAHLSVVTYLGTLWWFGVLVWCCSDPRLGTSYVSWLGPTSSCPLTDIYVIYLFDVSVFP